MSEFEDFMAEGADAFSEAVGGQVTFSIDGQAGTFTGDLDEYGVASMGLRSEGGGLVGEYTGAILAAARQFAGIAKPERTLEGKTLTIGERQFRIASFSLDSVFATIRLENPKKGK